MTGNVEIGKVILSLHFIKLFIFQFFNFMSFRGGPDSIPPGIIMITVPASIGVFQYWVFVREASIDYSVSDSAALKATLPDSWGTSFMNIPLSIPSSYKWRKIKKDLEI